MASLPANVPGNRGLVLNNGQVKFLAALRRAVPPAIPLYITSGTRTPERQAAALKTKRDLGDNLYKLYRADYIVKELMAVPNTVSAMSSIIRKWMKKGVFMSRHMRGDAVDLRSRNLTKSQIDTVMAAARNLGAKAIYETKPPHIHIESIGGTLSNIQMAAGEKSRQAQRGAKRASRRAIRLYKQRKILYTVIAAGASTGILALLFFASRRRKGQQ
tara:strand:- start:924 stop:1571 length:648 start_codon:yes stop_codon:yes gene_type:complete